MGLVAVFALSARVDLVVQRVVFLLLPPVRVRTSIFVFASIRVDRDEVFALPLGTLLLLVVVQVRLSSEVLPVVGIHTGISLVFGLIVGTPDGLEVEHVEVDISIHLVDHVHRELVLVMSKRT